MHQSSFSELQPPSTKIDVEGALAWVLGVLSQNTCEFFHNIVLSTKKYFLKQKSLKQGHESMIFSPEL